jgi:hypothetical protein
MFTQILSRGTAIIGNAEHVRSLCSVRLDLVGSRMMLLVEGAALQPVEETAGSARVKALESFTVAELQTNSKQRQPPQRYCFTG